MGDTATDIRKKIAYAVNNTEKFSIEELKAIRQEAPDFAQTLPENKRGAFLWPSHLEVISMAIGK